jgi:hypothetical protein
VADAYRGGDDMAEVTSLPQADSSPSLCPPVGVPKAEGAIMVQTTDDTRHETEEHVSTEILDTLEERARDFHEAADNLDDIVTTYRPTTAHEEVLRLKAHALQMRLDADNIDGLAERLERLSGTQGRCGGDCGFEDRPWHDEILALLGGAAVIGRLCYDLIEGGRADWLMAAPNEPLWEDIARFIRFHGWDDQVGMHTLAETLEQLSRFEVKADAAAGII